MATKTSAPAQEAKKTYGEWKNLKVTFIECNKPNTFFIRSSFLFYAVEGHMKGQMINIKNVDFVYCPIKIIAFSLRVFWNLITFNK